MNPPARLVVLIVVMYFSTQNVLAATRKMFMFPRFPSHTARRPLGVGHDDHEIVWENVLMECIYATANTVFTHLQWYVLKLRLQI